MILPTIGRFLAIRQREKAKPGDLLITSYKPVNIYRIVKASPHKDSLNAIEDEDIVVINPHGATPFEWKGKNHVFLKEDAILAYIADEGQYEDCNE